MISAVDSHWTPPFLITAPLILHLLRSCSEAACDTFIPFEEASSTIWTSFLLLTIQASCSVAVLHLHYRFVPLVLLLLRCLTSCSAGCSFLPNTSPHCFAGIQFQFVQCYLLHKQSFFWLTYSIIYFQFWKVKGSTLRSIWYLIKFL